MVPTSSEDSGEFPRFEGEIPDLEVLGKFQIPEFEMTSEIAHHIIGGFFEGIAETSEEDLAMYVDIWNNVIPDNFKAQVAKMMQKAVAKLQEDFASLRDEEKAAVDAEMSDFYCDELSEGKQQTVDATLQVHKIALKYN